MAIVFAAEQMGEAKTITMKLYKSGLAAWDPENHAWKVYPGTYPVMVGSSSRGIRLRGAFTISAK